MKLRTKYNPCLKSVTQFLHTRTFATTGWVLTIPNVKATQILIKYVPNYTKPWLNHPSPPRSSISRIAVHCAQATYLKYAHFTFLSDKSLAFLLTNHYPVFKYV